MALAFPLSKSAFFALLPISKLVFHLPDTRSHTRTRGGDIITSDNGARLWQGEVTLDRITRAELAAVRPLISLLSGTGSFMVYDVTRPFPQYDPDGSQLAGAAPVIAALPSAREISIGGLPVGYRLSRDDLLAFSYATNPVRHALHEVVTGGTANAAGIIPNMEVVPPIRPGAAIGAAVTLIRPACKAIIIPETLQPGTTRATLTDGVTFKFIQTLR